MLICQFEDSNKTSLRHVVVDNLVLDKNKILLVKRAAHLTNGGKYGLIGGYVNRDETIEEAAKREIMEETGYEVETNYLFRIKDSPKRPKEDRQNVAFVFVTTALKKTGKPDNEAKELNWFDFNSLPAADDFAFDHFEDIQLYLAHLKSPKKLPLFLSQK